MYVRLVFFPIFFLYPFLDSTVCSPVTHRFFDREFKTFTLIFLHKFDASDYVNVILKSFVFFFSCSVV